MNNTKFSLATLSIIAISTVANASELEDAIEKKSKADVKKERCFGIVKAGKNDCAASDGSHSCAGLAKNDGDGREWVLLPAGTCERILGGLITPKV